MTTVADLLAKLKTLDVTVTVSGDALECDAPNGVLTEALHQEILAYKPELVSLLKDREPAAEISPVDRSGAVQLSFAQERMWFLDKITHGSPVYNIVELLPIAEAASPEVVAAAFRALINRHEILRTAFLDAEGAPTQRILDAVAFTISEIDLTQLTTCAGDLSWDTFAAREARQAFDLASPPLFRVALVRQSPTAMALLIVLHHIIADEWSMQVLRRDLLALIDSGLHRTPVTLPALPVQYADYAMWHRRRVDELLDRQLTYWRGILAMAPAAGELSTDYVRPLSPSFRGATDRFTLAPDLMAAIKRLARAEQATPFMALLAGFVAMLARYSGRPDVLVGTPVSGRTSPEVQDLIGLFLNTVVIRAEVSDGLSFRNLLKHVRDRVLEAHANQDVPFERVVAELAPARDRGQSPLFQSMFVLNDADGASVSNGPNPEPETGTSKFDLTLLVSETETGAEGLIEYSTDLFTPATIARLGGHYRTLLAAIAREPDAPISTLTLLTEAEREQILGQANRAFELVQAPAGLVELFEAQVQKTPGQTAVTFGDASLTYAELNARANQLAHQLRTLGLNGSGLVGVCLERSLDLVAAVLGIVKAGAAYVPLEATFPTERLRHMVTDSQIAALVTQQTLAARVPAHPAVVVYTDRDSATLGRQPNHNPARQPPAVIADSLAYVLYTSGSTGTPKGVAVPHRALGNLLLSMQREPGFTAGDTLLAVTTLSFDIAGLEMFLPLISGGELVIASWEDTHDPRRLIDLIQKTGCTVMQATPTMWRALIAAGWSGAPTLRAFCGGEALLPSLAKDLLPRCAELWNLYGPTETTIWSTCRRIDDETRIDIGRPIANTDVYVLDDRRQLVPVGIAGELYVGGEGLAHGYFGQPELTTARFVSHPFREGARLYRTGDRARWLSDRCLSVLGRLDDQIKVRGYRVEPAEIENVLRTFSGVDQAVVRLREDTPGDPRLVAYTSGHGVSPAALREHLKRSLPDHLVPSAFVTVDRWPLTPSGKIDRRALPVPPRQASTDAVAAPATPTERRLAAIWGELLGGAEIQATDNFFFVGGHSLLAMRLLHRIHQEFSVQLGPGSLYGHPVLCDLAERIDNERSTTAPASQKALVRMEAGSAGVGFFWVHGITGEVFSYAELSRHLARRGPVYGLTADWTRMFDTTGLTIETVASKYVKEIRAAQPSGPYHLGGFCAAAPLALEIAYQIQLAGLQLGTIAILGYDLEHSHSAQSGFHSVGAFLRNLPRWVLDDAMISGSRELRGRLGSRWRKWSGSNGAGSVEPDIRDRLGMWRLPDHLVRMLEVHNDVIRRHTIKPLPGEIDLFLPRTGPLFGPWPSGSHPLWQDLARGGVRVHFVHGSHATMMKGTFAAELAAVIVSRLDEPSKTSTRP